MILQYALCQLADAEWVSGRPCTAKSIYERYDMSLGFF